MVSHTSPRVPLDLGKLSRDTHAAVTGFEILWWAGEHDDVARFLTATLPLLLATAKGDFAAVVSNSAGRWTALGETGRRATLPATLLASALDEEGPAAEDSWLVVPVLEHAASGELLALHTSAVLAAGAREVVEGLARVVGEGLTTVRARGRERRRLARFEAILSISNQWNQTHEMEPLLHNMAEAATRLLAADRASIFLWDRPNRTLVGRPALGVEGGELRIPDDKGIVGQVVQTGQARRVDAVAGQEQINRRVDAQLGYQTHTLLCVPLRSQRGELFGAFEMINKRDGQFTDEDEEALTELAAQAAIALENTQERQDLLASRRQIAEQAAQGVQLIGQSPPIEALRSTVRRVAKTDLAVLILGENGTGKEVVSQSIHYLSDRRDRPFIAVNCAAISETLLESELFGHEKGAFTDAHEARAGKFELASGGTLFLDEIGDLSLGGQAKLLRVLEDKVVVRVGGSKTIHTDARVIAATNQSLAEMVRQKRFRQDLYFRLTVVTLELPALRDRGDDILLLAEHFLVDFCRKARRKSPVLSTSARNRLTTHPWPGNVRELRNLMERLAYLTTGDRIEAEDLSFILSPQDKATTIQPDQPLAEATDQFQTEFIEQAIDRTGGNMSEAAKRLGLHRSNLYRKMRQLGMNVVE